MALAGSFSNMKEFYYNCGYCGHSMKDYEHNSDDEVDLDHGLNYGKWLHTFLLRRRMEDGNRDNSQSKLNSQKKRTTFPRN